MDSFTLFFFVSKNSLVFVRINEKSKKYYWEATWESERQVEIVTRV